MSNCYFYKPTNLLCRIIYRISIIHNLCYATPRALKPSCGHKSRLPLIPIFETSVTAARATFPSTIPGGAKRGFTPRIRKGGESVANEPIRAKADFSDREKEGRD